jgi:hypothetical protein
VNGKKGAGRKRIEGSSGAKIEIAFLARDKPATITGTKVEVEQAVDEIKRVMGDAAKGAGEPMLTFLHNLPDTSGAEEDGEAERDETPNLVQIKILLDKDVRFFKDIDRVKIKEAFDTKFGVRLDFSACNSPENTVAITGTKKANAKAEKGLRGMIDGRVEDEKLRERDRAKAEEERDREHVRERCQFIIAAELQPFVEDSKGPPGKDVRELFRLIDALILPKERCVGFE